VKGVPDNPVECQKCGTKSASPADRLCKKCCIVVRGLVHRKYFFTDEMDREIREAWMKARTKKQLTAAITLLEKKIGFDRDAIRRRATSMGLNYTRMRPWAQAELDFLRDHAGERSNWWIARKLKRSMCAVRVRASLLGVSVQVHDGYSRAQISQLLGVQHQTVRRWIDNGWLIVTPTSNTVPESSIERFIHHHPEQYDLRRVDQVWFKSIAFPAIKKNVAVCAKPQEAACA
jgi:hypothetical protein